MKNNPNWQWIKHKRCYSITWKKCLLLVAQVCPILWDPMECNRQATLIHGILQARILEWAAIPSSRGSSKLRDQTQVSHIAGRFFTI